MKNKVLYCISAAVATLVMVAWVMGLINPIGLMTYFIICVIAMGYIPMISTLILRVK